MRRVVVTGMGVVSPLGRGVEHNWKCLLEGKSGIGKIENIDLKDIPVTIAGQVPWGDGEVNTTLLLKTLEEVGFKGVFAIEREAGNDRVGDIALAAKRVLAAG